MANLKLEDFSEEYRKTAPMECSLYLVSCLDKDTQTHMEQIEPKSTDKYHYEFIIYPERLVPKVEVK